MQNAEKLQALSRQEFWPTLAIELHGQSEEMTAVVRDAPAPRPRDFRLKVPRVQVLDQARNFRAPTPVRLGVGTEQRGADVFVPEPARDVVAIQDGGEQAEIVTPGRIDARRVPTRHRLRFGELTQLLVRRGRMVDDCQGIELAAVASQSLLLVVDQAARVFVHR
jgi:hypothetical protein